MATWQPYTLSRTQVRAADRVGGIDLILPWPDGLPPGAPVALDEERDATQAEHAASEAIVGASCRADKLVPVRSCAAMLFRPHTVPGGGRAALHLIVTIIGHRWVHATGSPEAREFWAPVERVELLPIATERAYRAALREIEGLMRAKAGTPAGTRLDALAKLVEAWEAKRHKLK